MSKIWLMALVMLIAVTGGAADVNLAWDASTSPEVTGYRIYVGTQSGDYIEHHVVPNQTTYTVTGLTPGVRYFFAATATTLELESGFSNEVNTWAEDNSTLVVTSQGISVNWYGVVLLAVSNRDATAILRYKLMGEDAPWQTIIASPEPAREHRAIIYDLPEPTTYAYYQYTWIVTSDEQETSVGSTFKVGE